MSDPQNSETSDDSTIVVETEMLPTETPQSFQQFSRQDLNKPLRYLEKVELWLRTGFSGNARPLTEGGGNLQHGWLAPYIEQDLSASTLRSSEKVELWLKAHFSHTVSESLHDKKGNSIQYGGEKTNSAESTITSLAALEFSP